MSMSRQKEELARRLLKLANELLAAEEEEEEEEDPRFIEKIRNLKKMLSKLSSKKKRKLNQYGVGVIKGNNTVEDLVNALSKVVAG
jgi:hypothetical protein